jgi:hypothetical protein
MTHDVISDILAADTVPPEKKREVIYAALDEMQDSTQNVMSMDEWRGMGEMMGGVAAMGGPATGIVSAPPSRDVPADVMHRMTGRAMQHGDSMPGMRHGAADANATDTAGGAAPAHGRQMMELHMRMMADPAIRERMMADTAMRRLMAEMMDSMPADTKVGPPPARPKGAKRAAPHKPEAAAPKPDPHAGHQTEPAKPAPTKPAGPTHDSMPGMSHDTMPGMGKP